MAEDLLGTVIAGKYRLVSVLGAGAMGVVYRAEQLDAEGQSLREVALKTVQPELSRDPMFVRRFLREVRIAARLGSPYIVTVYDAGQTEGGQLYFTMEMVRGPTLRELVTREGSLPLERAVTIIGQICEALAEAHGLPEPIVHRDLKPPNVFVQERHGRDWAKVTDFGIAKVIGEETGALTATGSSPGTPRYMAPEQWRGKDVGVRADLYAVGVMLYELLAGEPPFRGGIESLMYQTLNEAPPPLPDTVPAPLRAEVMRLLAKKPEDRHPDALSVKRALESAVAKEPDLSATEPLRGESLRSREDPRFARQLQTPTEVISQRPARRVAPWAYSAAIILLIVGLAVALRWAQSSREEPRTPETVPGTFFEAKKVPGTIPPPTAAPAATSAPTLVPAPTSEPKSAAVASSLGKTPAENSCDRQPVSQAEVDGWVEEYRRALERKDVPKLRELGAVGSEQQASSLRAKLRELRDYQVHVENLEAELHGAAATVRFDRADKWKDPNQPSFVLDFTPETKKLVRRDCRLVAEEAKEGEP